jgi:DNA-binding LacI/PurR family transcriptional regulator
MAATVHQVAEVAGVSTSTVSRAFGRPELLNPQTREAVLSAATRLGYTPNRAARGLVTGRTGNLGMVVPDIANPFFPPLVKGATDRASMADLGMFLASSDLDAERELQAVQRMVKQVDGLVLCSTQLDDATVRRLAETTRLVLVNRTIRGIDSVVHLHALGHTSFVYLSGPNGSWSNEQRRQALRAQARKRGLRVSTLGPYLPTYESGVQAADQILAQGASAVIAYDDQMALGVLTRLHERGARVPDDVSVVGCDDVLPGGVARPSLTTVSGPCREVGRMAVELLLGVTSCRTEDRSGTEVRQPTQLVVRASTGLAREVAGVGERSHDEQLRGRQREGK